MIYCFCKTFQAPHLSSPRGLLVKISFIQKHDCSNNPPPPESSNGYILSPTPRWDISRMIHFPRHCTKPAICLTCWQKIGTLEVASVSTQWLLKWRACNVRQISYWGVDTHTFSHLAIDEGMTHHQKIQLMLNEGALILLQAKNN